MHFKGRLELEQGLKQIDITPLVNILFLLLIFLVLTSGFLLEPSIRINLPKSLTSEAVQYGAIEILVSAENLFYLEGKAVTFDELKALFRQAASRNSSILIKADSQASLGRVAQLMDAARGMGVTALNLVTNQE